MSKQTALSSTSSAKVNHALKVLAQLREKREKEMDGLSTDAIHDESDVENVHSHLFLIDSMLTEAAKC